MNIDLAALQVLLLALPGFVWVRFTHSIKGTPRSNPGSELISGLIFGTLTYIVLYPIYLFFGFSFDMSTFGTEVWKFEKCLDEVLFSLPMAILLSSGLLFLRRRNFPLGMLRSFGVTNYSGDTDIWDYCFSELRPNGSFVNVRDHDEGLIFQGFTQGFSERGDLRELLLSDVEVFKSDGEPLYKTSAIYLGRAPEKISIDFYEEEGEANVETNQERRGFISWYWNFLKWW